VVGCSPSLASSFAAPLMINYYDETATVLHPRPPDKAARSMLRSRFMRSSASSPCAGAACRSSWAAPVARRGLFGSSLMSVIVRKLDVSVKECAPRDTLNLRACVELKRPWYSWVISGFQLFGGYLSCGRCIVRCDILCTMC
jgi:hypothetical protein